MHFATGTNFGLVCLLSRHGFHIGNDLINNLWLVHPPEPRASVLAHIIIDGNMYVACVLVTACVLTVAFFSTFFRPNPAVEYKVLDSLVLLKFIKDVSTVNTVLKVVS